MKFWQSILFLCLVTAACQETRREYYPNGALRIEGTYVDGKREGLTKTYFPSGLLESEGKYEGNIPIGSHHEFYPSGKLKAESNFNLGKLEGERRKLDENGKVRLLANFSDDKLNGECKYFNQEGKLLSKANFARGMANGKWERYDDKGQIIMSGSAVDGELDGEALSFSENSTHKCKFKRGAVVEADSWIGSTALSCEIMGYNKCNFDDDYSFESDAKRKKIADQLGELAKELNDKVDELDSTSNK